MLRFVCSQLQIRNLNIENFYTYYLIDFFSDADGIQAALNLHLEEAKKERQKPADQRKEDWLHFMKEQMEMKELLVEINNVVDFNRELR